MPQPRKSLQAHDQTVDEVKGHEHTMNTMTTDLDMSSYHDDESGINGGSSLTRCHHHGDSHPPPHPHHHHHHDHEEQNEVEMFSLLACQVG